MKTLRAAGTTRAEAGEQAWEEMEQQTPIDYHA